MDYPFQTMHRNIYLLCCHAYCLRNTFVKWKVLIGSGKHSEYHQTESLSNTLSITSNFGWESLNWFARWKHFFPAKPLWSKVITFLRPCFQSSLTVRGDYSRKFWKSVCREGSTLTQSKREYWYSIIHQPEKWNPVRGKIKNQEWRERAKFISFL